MQVEFFEGTLVRFSINFVDQSTQNAVDPTEIAFAYMVNGGSPVTTFYSVSDGALGTIIRDAIGTYHVDVDTTGLSGSWTFEWKSKGVGQSSTVGAIVVSATPISIVWS